MQQLRHEREYVTVHSRNLETEQLAWQSAVRSLEAQVSQFLHLRGMLDVERQKTNTLQEEVLRGGAENLQLSQHLGCPVLSSLQ